MVDAKAKFVELETALAAAEDWTHEEEDRVRDTIEALEHEFEAYLAEARGQVAELADISATTGEDDKIVYDIARKKADKDPDVDWSFIDRVAPTIEGKQACQPTGDVAMLYRQARSIHGDFSRLVEGVEASLGAGSKAKARVAPLKHLYRIVEKKTFSTRYPGRADGVCDIVRALFECETKAAMAAVDEALATHEGLVVVRGEDRWRNPTEGSWADFMVNFRLKADRNRHVAEVQIVHRKLMIAREGLDGHAAYAQGRAATETLEKLEALGVALPKPTKREPHAFAAALAARPSAQQLAPPAATPAAQPSAQQLAPPAVAAPEKAVAAPVAQAMSARVAPEAPPGADFPGRVDPKALDGEWCCYLAPRLLGQEIQAHRHVPGQLPGEGHPPHVLWLRGLLPLRRHLRPRRGHEHVRGQQGPQYEGGLDEKPPDVQRQPLLPRLQARLAPRGVKFSARRPRRRGRWPRGPRPRRRRRRGGARASARGARR